MCLLYNYRKHLTLISISALSGMTHNLIQLIVIKILLFRNVDIFSRNIFLFVTIFLAGGILSGAIVGAVADNMKLRKKY